jgi:hypothetical protein
MHFVIGIPRQRLPPISDWMSVRRVIISAKDGLRVGSVLQHSSIKLPESKNTDKENGTPEQEGQLLNKT